MAEGKEPVPPFGSFLFLRIFQAFRLSIQPSKLALAFLAVTAICLTGWTLDLVQTSLGGGFSGPYDLRSMGVRGSAAGVFAVLGSFCAEQFHGGLYGLLGLDIPAVFTSIGNCVQAVAWTFVHHPLYSIVFSVAVLAILSLAGGAICRMAALQFAHAEAPTLRQAVRFSIRRFVSLFTAPLTPVGMIALVGLSIVLLGLIGNIHVVGELLVGLLLPLTLLAAVFIAVVLVGFVAGLNLMFPAIAYEDADSFDAIGRSFAYVYDKLWLMGFYAVVAAAYGAVCYVFVRLFLFLLLSATYGFLQVGFAVLHNQEKLREIWPGPTFGNFWGEAATTPAAWSTWLGAWLIHLWVLAATGIVVSFLVSFYFSASTVIYALMRHRVDGTPLEEIYVYSEKPAEVTAAEVPAGQTAAEPQA
jgi:hypothetical protein